MKDSSQRWWDFWSACLLLVILTIVSSRLAATNWTQHLHVIQLLSLVACGAGLLLGFSQFSAPLTLIFAFDYGAFYIPFALALVLTDQAPWLLRIYTLAYRLKVATETFIQHRPVNDPILFLSIMALLFWGLSLSAGYQLTRKASFWKSVLPAGLVLMIVNHYDRYANGGMVYLGIFIFLALILLGRQSELRHQAAWQLKGITLSTDTRGELFRASLFMVIGLVFITWLAPVNIRSSQELSSFWAKNIIQPWNQLSTNARNAFTSLKSQSPQSQVSFSNTLTLAHGSQLLNTTLFTVEANKTIPLGAQYYWRARTFDTYANGQWSDSLTQTQSFSANDLSVDYPTYTDRQTIEFTFTTQSIFIDLPTPAMPVWIDRPVNALLFSPQKNLQDVLGLIATPALGVGEVYHVRGLISSPNVQDLESATTAYPEAIAKADLTLSPELAAKLKPLALQITAGAKTPYEKANALTLWLRSHMTYAATISADIPTDEDPVIWFLFDSKTGYCDYYASADVLLLRSIGIPARISEGYAAGTYKATTNTYSIHQSDAHAWPEVYFPELGWIEFEPTSSQAYRTLPLTNSQGNSALITTVPQGKTQQKPTYQPINATPTPTAAASSLSAQTIFILLLITCLGLADIILLYYRWHSQHQSSTQKPLPVRIEAALKKYDIAVPGFIHRWSQHAALTPIERTFAALKPLLWLLHLPVLPQQTPGERVASLVAALPLTAKPAQELLDEYQKAEYSQHSANVAIAVQALATLRGLILKAFFMELWTLDRSKKKDNIA